MKRLLTLVKALSLRSRSPSPKEEEAMISKKPIDGLACASCDKSLSEQRGQPAEYTSWQKLPNTHRDPKDRISNV